MTVRSVEVARLFYRTDCGRSDGEELSLGVLAFVESVGDRDGHSRRLMMLIARDELDPGWKSKMNPIASMLLRHPAKFFRAEIDAAINEGAQDILPHLSDRFHWSISISKPKALKPTGDLARTLAALMDGLGERARGEVRPPTPPRRQVFLSYGSGPEHGGDARVIAQIAGPDLQEAVTVSNMPPVWMIDAGPFRGGRVH